MKKIEKELWTKKDDFCFGCSEKNPIGLKLNFYDMGDYIETQWLPNKNYEGWQGVLHGGIIATLLDEIGGWVVVSKIGIAGMTVELNVRYHKQISSNQLLTLRGKLVDVKKNIAFIQAEIIQNDIVKASGISKYFLFDQKTSREQYQVINNNLKSIENN